MSVRAWLLGSGLAFTVVALAALGVARRQAIRQEPAAA
jgi:hypothetical protein